MKLYGTLQIFLSYKYFVVFFFNIIHKDRVKKKKKIITL